MTEVTAVEELCGASGFILRDAAKTPPLRMRSETLMVRSVAGASRTMRPDAIVAGINPA